MSEEKKFDFSVPSDAGGKAKQNGQKQGVLWLVVILVIANIGLTVRAPKGGASAPDTTESGSLDALRSLAVKLEEQGLHMAAASTWVEYLQEPGHAEDEQARIWYRVGTMRQEAGEYESALAAYYRSEKIAKVSEIESEIGRRVQDCLEGMGKFAALKHELSSRVGIGDQKGSEGAKVVAEIGSEKLTLGQLDRLVERRVDQQLAMMRGGVEPEQLKQQKEAMMKQLSSADQRRQFLIQWISEEVLFRKAVKENLLEDEAVAAAVHEIQRNQLASLYMQRMMNAAMHVSDSDVQDYYKANPAEFTQPRQVHLAHILVDSEDEAKELQKQLADGGDFAELAKKHSTDEGTKEQGGEISGWVTSGAQIAGQTAASGTHQMIAKAKAGDVLPELVKVDAGYQLIKVLEAKAEKLATFEETKARAKSSLTRRREMELQRALMEELKNEFDVVLHESVLGGGESK